MQYKCKWSSGRGGGGACIGRGHSILLQVTQIESAQGEKLITYVKVSLEACELNCRRKNSEFLAKIKKQIYLTYM